MISEYLQPFQFKNEEYYHLQLGNYLKTFLENQNYKDSIGIVSIQRHRREDKSRIFAQGVREQLYRMYQDNVSLVDLGDFIQGNTLNDTDFAIKDLLKNLKNVFGKLIVITDDGAFLENSLSHYSKSNYLQENTITFSPQHQNYIIDHLMEDESQKFHLNIMGYQNYYFSMAGLEILNANCHEAYRLGFIKENMEITETLLRRSDLFYFSMNAIRNSDYNFSEEPNGFKADEICKLMHYAGYSSKLKQIIIGGYFEEHDQNITSKKLMAQMIWHAINADATKIEEHPETHSDQFIKYTTSLQHENLPLFFHKSKLSKRWWMEMEHPKKGKENTKNLIVPCTSKDYDMAVSGEPPELWWIMTNRYASS